MEQAHRRTYVRRVQREVALNSAVATNTVDKIKQEGGQKITRLVNEVWRARPKARQVAEENYRKARLIKNQYLNDHTYSFKSRKGPRLNPEYSFNLREYTRIKNNFIQASIELNKIIKENASRRKKIDVAPRQVKIPKSVTPTGKTFKDPEERAERVKAYNNKKKDEYDAEMAHERMSAKRVTQTRAIARDQKRLTGGGERRSRLNNRGTGGKSKVPRTPLPPIEEQEELDPEEAERLERHASIKRAFNKVNGSEVDGDRVNAVGMAHLFGPTKVMRSHRVHPAYNDFVYGKPPNQGMLMNDNLYRVMYEVVDLDGAPFCGLVCIDTAVGKEVNITNYQRLFGQFVNRDPDCLESDTCGDSDYLIEYCLALGVNLAIYKDRGNGLKMEIQKCHCSTWKWVLLRHVDKDNIGHYQLVTSGSSGGQSFTKTRVTKNSSWNWKRYQKVGAAAVVGAALCHPLGSLFLLGAKLCTSIKVVTDTMFFAGVSSNVVDIDRGWELGEEVCNRSTDDRRNVVEQRDELVTQDSYRKVTENINVRFFLSTLEGPILTPELPGPLPGLLGIGEYYISEVRFNQAFSEAQLLSSTGRDPGMAKAGIGALREVNTDSSGMFIVDTCRFFDLAVVNLQVNGKRTLYDGLVATNAPGATAALPRLENIEANQVQARLAGSGKLKSYSKRMHVNHVVKYSLTEGKSNKPVAVAPVGVLECSEGRIVSPGFINLTDSPSTLAAFMRSMSVVPVDVDDEVDASLRLLDKYINSADVANLVETDNIDQYRKHYRGKKTQRQIDADVREYGLYQQGLMTPRQLKKFINCSIFVKFESNMKKNQGVFKPRPRGIICMAPLMVIELIHVHQLLDRWNHGDFRHFQIKGLTYDEMVMKITQACRRPFAITDMSSFEASVNHMVRRLESYVIIRLCKRSGFNRTKSAYYKWVGLATNIHSKWGSFSLQSRASGHPWTSVGNGIASWWLNKIQTIANRVCPKVYNKELVVAELRLATNENNCCDKVFEGDDGIVPLREFNEVASNSVGFKLSSEFLGTQPGDADFLRSLWVDGKRVLNVGRCLASLLWISDAANLKKSKQMWLLRCKATSLYWLAPGQPVLTSIINYISKLTAPYMPFKNYQRYLNTWGGKIFTGLPKVIEVDASYREIMARGGKGVPAIPFAIQLELERRFSSGEFYVGNLLDHFDDLKDKSTTQINRFSNDTQEMQKLVTILGDQVNPTFSWKRIE
jgi:hypothetical protein